MLLSDVCLSRTSGLSREQRPRKIKIGTEVAYVTRESDTTFNVKRSKAKVTRPLWFAILADQHGYRISNRSRYVYDVYRDTTCRPGRGHIEAASRLQFVNTEAVFCHMTDGLQFLGV